MMKKLNNDVLQFDNYNELFNYCIKNYVNLFENEIDVNIIEMYCKMYEMLQNNDFDEYLYFILFDDCFIVYEKNNFAFSYIFDDCNIIDDEYNYYDNYDEFLNEYKLHYIE